MDSIPLSPAGQLSARSLTACPVPGDNYSSHCKSLRTSSHDCVAISV